MQQNRMCHAGSLAAASLLVRVHQVYKLLHVPNPCSRQDTMPKVKYVPIPPLRRYHDFGCSLFHCPSSRDQERRIKVEALDWSDTATFLVEAEVYHPLQNAEVHKSYPVIFGRVMNFTLPPSAEGVCIEADMQGNHIIFPLGPNPPVLQWADCSVRSGENKTKAYRCELKDGYRF